MGPCHIYRLRLDDGEMFVNAGESSAKRLIQMFMFCRLALYAFSLFILPDCCGQTAVHLSSEGHLKTCLVFCPSC